MRLTQQEGYLDPFVSFDRPSDAVRIATASGHHFRIKLTCDGNLEVHFAGTGAKYLLAVLPKSGNLVELQPSEH